ncbi:MAG: SMP-30/gluconolactonase/LRE family protein [Thaumarchaeota archaeon]|nr:SMP-30/gluconolactonase/LRE family protein [Nitrososphaerota archaeon]
MTPEVASNVRAQIGEGPTWDARKNVLYWVDITGGVVYAHTPKKPHDEVVQSVKDVSSVVPRKGGGLALTSQHRYFALDLKSKDLSPLTASVEAEIETNRFNDGKCDAAGRYWAGTMDTLQKTRSGALYVLEKGRRPKKVISGVTISNGLGWSPDNKTMYYIDSPTRKVSALDYSLKTGTVKNRRTIVDFSVSKQPGKPDGMSVDSEGMIWVAHWGGSRLTRWDPSNGKLLETIAMPAEQVASCCFGGKNLDDLYITTARIRMDAKTLAAKPLNGALFVVKPGVKGLPTNEFDG